jgi:hypothetical protein
MVIRKAEQNDAEGIRGVQSAAYVSMSCPLIREPALINPWRSGDLRRATCVSDNKCFRPVRAGEGVYCVDDLGRRQVEGERDSKPSDS